MILWMATLALAAQFDPAAPISKVDDKECGERTEAEQASFTQELKGMYDAMGEAERRSSGKLKGTALKSAKAAVKLERQGKLCTDEDRFWAAMVMLNAEDEEAAALAFGLSKALIESRYPRGAWVAANAYDKWAVAFGNLQSYGTQTNWDGQRQCLYWVDPAFTDEKRKAYGQPLLAEVITRVLETNGYQGEEPTVARLKHLDLWCKPQPWSGGRSDLQDPYGR